MPVTGEGHPPAHDVASLDLAAALRPSVRFLSQGLLERIVDEARRVLARVGVAVENPGVEEMLLNGGCQKEAASGRLLFPGEVIDAALRTTPSSLCLYDREGELCAELHGDRVHFTPGSSAIYVLDGESGERRKPTTGDYVRYVRLVERLDAIHYQSTAFIPADVHEQVADSYRLYLSLVHGRKPVVTGAFSSSGFQCMVELLMAVRGGRRELVEKPCAIFSACPTAPLRWSEATSQNVFDCARYQVPIEFISMPLTGFVAPGTLVGTLVQHTAETLSGVVISQMTCVGAPVLWGGSPAIFDFRYETPPVGAIESQMIACAYAEIGKHLDVPTQAYIGLADAQAMDAQAGLETGSGLILAALAGINSVSGPGLLDFENTVSLEKLVVDNEICAMALRMVRGIEPRDGDFPSEPHFRDLLAEGHSLISRHTRRWIRKEIHFPGPVINRANHARFVQEGSLSQGEHARREVARHLAQPPNPIDGDRRRALDEIMAAAASEVGMHHLPSQDAQA